MTKLKVDEKRRKRITEAAGHYLSDQPSGTLYGAYNELKNAQDEGNGSALADNYVVVWEPLTHMSVDQIVELIENSAKGNDMEDQPEFIQKIDWKLLRKQKLTLLETIDDMEKRNSEYYKDSIEDLTGILHLIDSLQDYAVDEMGIDETEWDNLEE